MVQLGLKDYLRAEKIALAINTAREHGWKQGRTRGNLLAHRKHGDEEHITGYCAELAVARYLKVDWDPPINQGQKAHELPDIDPDIEVRASLTGDRLVVRDKDADNRRYVLACAEGRRDFFLAGWLWGFEAKDPAYRRDPKGYGAAYFVPYNKLRTMESIRA